MAIKLFSIGLFDEKDELTRINIEVFPDHTPLIHVDIEGFELSTLKLEIKWDYENDSELMDLIYITRYLQDKGVPHIGLTMPYIPNARYDRINNADEVFTLKYFVEVINSLHFDYVDVLDAHSNVSLALIDRVRQIDVAPLIQKAIDDFKPDVLFMPDEGAHKRYSKMFTLPSTFGIKTRDWRTGEIKDYFLAEQNLVKGKRVLIIDDICSRGGTFYYASKLLRDNGATSTGLYVTHCEENIANGNLLNKEKSGIEQIYTANPLWHRDMTTSVYSPLDEIKVID